MGDAVGVLVFVTLGDVFSDRVQAITETLGNFAWVGLALIAAALFAWQLVKYMRGRRRARASSDHH